MELSKGEYASTIMMPTKKYIFGNWTERCMCGNFTQSTSTHIWTNMPCLYWKRFLMPLVKPRFSIPWTWSLATIRCHWGRVTSSRWHFGELILMGRIVCNNGGFCHLVWRMPLQNFKGWWIGCWQDLVLPSATLMKLSFSAWHQRIISIIYMRYSEDLKIITLIFIQANVDFSKYSWNT